MADSDRSALEDARKRARRRLVGAIVLVLIAAVVLPMFLETDPKPLGPDVQLQIPPIDDGKFQNRLTPEPKGAAKGEIRPGPSTAPVVDVNRASAAIASDSTPPGNSGKASAPDSAKAVAAEKAPTAEKAPSSEKASSAAASVAANPAVSATANPTKGVPNGAFVVQLGAFVGLPVAVELADKARDMGYPAFLEKVTTTGGPVHRVRVGPYATLGQAQADAVKLKLAGITADVRKR